MMIVADLGGVERAAPFALLLHFSAAHTFQAQEWMEWGSLKHWTLHWADWPVAHFSHLSGPSWNTRWAWLITLKNKWDVGGL